jgi:hypothetical protein
MTPSIETQPEICKVYSIEKPVYILYRDFSPWGEGVLFQFTCAEGNDTLGIGCKPLRIVTLCSVVLKWVSQKEVVLLDILKVKVKLSIA